MNKIRGLVKTFLGTLIGGGTLYLLWLVLFREINPVILVSGVFVIGLVILLYRTFELSIDIPVRTLMLPLIWLKFFALLILEIARSTVRTCYIILTGKANGKIVAYDTRLESGFEKLFLLNSITLTPITIGILSEKNLVYIHHLDLRDRDDYEDMVEKIRSEFEEPIMDLLG